MRRTTSIAAGLLALALMPVPAGAQDLPAWKISEVCAGESAPGQCAVFESEAARTLSGSWGFIAAKARADCLASLKTPADRSYRLLAECIDGAAIAAGRRHAVQTSATPAEPVPPPKPPVTPTVSPTVTPPPAGLVPPTLPFGIPAGPPKAD